MTILGSYDVLGKQPSLMLYLLVLTDQELSYDNYSEDFYIGIFKSEKEAEETDIIESSCFLTEERAGLELQIMKKTYQRTEWTISQLKIGALEWRDGFARMVGGLPVN